MRPRLLVVHVQVAFQASSLRIARLEAEKAELASELGADLGFMVKSEARGTAAEPTTAASAATAIARLEAVEGRTGERVGR